MVGGTGWGRRREREQVEQVARRRLALLEKELAGFRPQIGVDPGWVEPEPPHERPRSRGPGQHRQSGASGHSGQPGQRPPLRPGRPGALHDPGEEDPFAGRGTSLAGIDPVLLPAGGRSPLSVGRPAFGRLEGRQQGAPDPAPAPVTASGRLGEWLADRLPDTVRGRTGLSGRAVVGLVVLVLGGLGVVGWTALRSGGGDPVPEAQVRTVAGTGSPSASPVLSAATPSGQPGGAASPGPGAASGTPAVAPSTGDVVVDVAGKVRRPGIVTLPTGSRVHQAIQRAGGARPGVSLTSINLARVLVDGEQIVVGIKGGAAAVAPATGATGGSGTASASTGGALVDLNTADATALDTLPGVGEVTAQKILDWRTSHGAFTAVDDLLDVDGIGEKTLADIKPHVTV